MYNIDQFKEKLQTYISGKRLAHSLSVADDAVRIAKIYGADEEKAYVAGLLHDVTKQESIENQLLMAAEFGIILSSFERAAPKLLHAKTAPEIMRRDFGIEDEEILDAVRFHTTGKAGMSLLGKIIYAADYVEPLRDFKGVEKLRKLVDKDLDEALIAALEMTICDILKDGKLLHSDTVNARNELVERRTTLAGQES